MEFGKVDPRNLGQIDFRLPDEDPRTISTLRASRELRLRPDLHRVLPVTQTRIGVGAPAWAVKEWLGQVYPLGTAPRDFLSHYARQFNSIELNSTHYGIPNEETVTRWRESTPSGFKFNVKFFQNISHHAALDENAALVRQFVSAILPLEDRLGLCFLQLPPHFDLGSLPRLARFLGQVPRELPLAVEVRHPSFFSENRLVPAYYDVLADHGAHVVITDVSGRRDVLHSSLPSSRAIVRFIGNGLDQFDEPRLDEWSSRLRSWMHMGLEQVEFFVHEPEDILVPDVAGRLIDRLNHAGAVGLTRWQPTDVESQLKLL